MGYDLAGRVSDFDSSRINETDHRCDFRSYWTHSEDTVMDAARTVINGLSLPDVLVRAIESGRWTVPSSEKLRSVFPLGRLVQPRFYDFDEMNLENESWLQENDPVYLGAPDETASPGDIVPSQSVLIGDLGPDQPIALDYRGPARSPRVVYLPDQDDTRWIEAAANVEELLEKLAN